MCVGHTRQRFHREPVLDRHGEHAVRREDTAHLLQHRALQVVGPARAVQSSPLQHAVHGDEPEVAGREGQREPRPLDEGGIAAAVLAGTEIPIPDARRERIEAHRATVVLAEAQDE